MKELSKSRIETDSIKRQMLQQEIAFNIQQTDALTRQVSVDEKMNSLARLDYLRFINVRFRSLSPSAGDPNTSLLRSSTSQLSPYDTHSLSRRHLKSRIGVVEDDTSKVSNPSHSNSWQV